MSNTEVGNLLPPSPSQKVRHYDPGRILPVKAENSVVQLNKVKNGPIKLKWTKCAITRLKRTKNNVFDQKVPKFWV